MQPNTKEIIDHIIERYGEHIEMYPQEEQWAVIAHILAHKLSEQEWLTDYYREMFNVRTR